MAHLSIKNTQKFSGIPSPHLSAAAFAHLTTDHQVLKHLASRKSAEFFPRKSHNGFCLVENIGKHRRICSGVHQVHHQLRVNFTGAHLLGDVTLPNWLKWTLQSHGNVLSKGGKMWDPPQSKQTWLAGKHTLAFNIGDTCLEDLETG